MLKSILCGLGLGLTAFSAQAQWVYQPIGFAATQTAPFLFDAVDATTAWGVSVGALGYVVPQLSRTTTAGQTWTVSSLPLQTSLGEDVTALAALNATTAWLTTVNGGGGGGRLLRTVDGGQTWNTQSSATVFGSAASYPTLIRFFSATAGVAVGQPLTSGAGFETYTTTTAGVSWTRVATVPATLAGENLGTTPPTVVGTHIWFVTSEGRVFHSPDQGLSWTVAVVSANLELTYVLFRDTQNGLITALDGLGTNHQLFRSADGGTTWASVAYTGPLHGVGLSAVPGTTQYVSAGADLGNGDQGSSYSRDNGQTWVSIENTFNHLGVEFVSPSVGWSGAFQQAGTQLTGGALRYSGTALATRTDAALQYTKERIPKNPLEDPI